MPKSMRLDERNSSLRLLEMIQTGTCERRNEISEGENNGAKIRGAALIVYHR
jgi:hypothetical protein